MHTLGIIFLSVAAAIVYGVLQDQITARVCVEYFTIGHPPVFETQNPTLLALGWGVIATWWVGLLLGMALAVAARAGRRPRRGAASLLRPIGILFAVTALGTLGAGLLGWALARAGTVYLAGPLATRVPPDKHVPFLADLWAHSASYLLGFIGGVVVIVWVWRSRGQLGGPQPV